MFNISFGFTSDEVKNTRCGDRGEDYTWCHVINVKGEGFFITISYFCVKDSENIDPIMIVVNAASFNGNVT